MAARSFKINGMRADWDELIKLAMKHGYNPQPFCSVTTKAAAAFLRKKEFVIVEPHYVSDKDYQRARHQNPG